MRIQLAMLMQNRREGDIRTMLSYPRPDQHHNDNLRSVPVALRTGRKRLLTSILFATIAVIGHAQSRVRDLIYLKDGGTAFTMDVFRPAKPNGAGVIYMVSGGFYSNHSMIDPVLAKSFTDHGLTVFAVVHGSRPKYTVQEIVPQVRRAVRFIHSVSAQYRVDPKRLGVTGISSGGVLTLLLAGTGDAGNSKAADPVDRESCELKAAVAIAPATDFLNWGQAQQSAFADKKLAPLLPAFGISSETSADGVRAIAYDYSPLYTVTDHFPVTLLVHGDSDALVPIQQSKLMDAVLEQHHTKHKLIVVKGGGHDDKTFGPGIEAAVRWFVEKL